MPVWYDESFTSSHLHPIAAMTAPPLHHDFDSFPPAVKRKVRNLLSFLLINIGISFYLQYLSSRLWNSIYDSPLAFACQKCSSGDDPNLFHIPDRLSTTNVR